MPARARGVPLATLVGVVVVLVTLRACEERRVAKSRGRPTSPAAKATSAIASVDAGVFVARAPVAREPAGELDAGGVDADAGDAGDAGDASSPDAGVAFESVPLGAAHMLHGGPRHAHRASARGPERAKVRWQTAVGGAVEAQVVASPDEKTLYAASLDGSLTALDVETGAKQWTLPLGDRAYSTPCVSPAGTIYVGSDAHRFYAVSSKGTVVWKLETNGDADTGAVLAGSLVVFASGPSVYAVRPGGDVAWRFDAKRKVFTAPALEPSGVVVFGSQDHRLYAVTPAGALAWSLDLNADVDGAPAIGDDGAITVGTDGGEVVRVSASGDLLWRAPVGGFVRGTLSLSRNGDALAGVYGPTPRVVRVGADGAVLASFAVQGTGSREFGVHGGPLEDASGALFFGAQDDDVHALGPDGTWQWSFATGGDVDAPLTLLSDGALVAASDDGNVTLFDP